MRSTAVFRLFLSTIVLCLVFTFPISADDAGDWKKAAKKNTIEAYEQFLNKRPRSPFATEANTRIEKLREQQRLAEEKVEYDTTLASGSLDGYERFLAAHPSSSFSAEVKRHFDEKLKQVQTAELKRVCLIEEGLADVGPELLPAAAHALQLLGLEVDRASKTACSALLKLSDIRRYVSGMVSFTVDLSTNQASPTMYGLAVKVRMDHQLVGTVFDGQLQGPMVGGGMGDGPDTPEVRKYRIEGLLGAVTIRLSRQLVRYFGSERFRQAVSSLSAELRDTELWKRRAAAGILGYIGGAEAVTALIEIALKDSINAVRADAARSLGEIGDPRAVAPLVETLKEHDWAVIPSSVEALGELGDRGAVVPLIDIMTQALDAKDTRLAQEARNALMKITNQNIEANPEKWREWLRTQG